MTTVYKQWHTKVEIVPMDSIPSATFPKWARIILDLPEGKAGRIVVGEDLDTAKRLQSSILASVRTGRRGNALNSYTVHACVRQEGDNFAVYLWKVSKEEGRGSKS